MSTLRELFTNTRIIILIIFLLLSVFAIHPTFSSDGVAVRSVLKNSSASEAGMLSPSAGSTPTSREVIHSINNVPIIDEASYFDVISLLEIDDQVVVKTKQGFEEKTYFLIVRPEYLITTLNETEIVTKEVFNETLNKTVNLSVEQAIVEQEIIGVEDLGLTIYNRPTNNIRKGLDLEGGTRVLLAPEREVTADELDMIIESIKQRLNIYGVSDIIVRPTKDLDGNIYISVEIAGVNKDEIRELLAKQGKFEAKVGSDTVFLGGNDITYVCRTPDCSGIDTQRGCGQVADGSYVCSFRFSISLSAEAAQRQAAATDKLKVIVTPEGSSYLSENLTLFLDNELVDELRIAADLKGSSVTDISISGSGAGPTEQEAVQDTLANMKNLQTVLRAGSLPVKLDIVKTDAISPVLGQTFLKNILLVGALAILAVVLVVFIRYREWRLSLPMVITMASEVAILLGAAGLLNRYWQLDLAAIAGIIIAVGTGVDDQIVIADEIMRGEQTGTVLSWTERLKRAFFIIMAAYFTTVVAMIPLLSAGAGLLKGFAITTIIGVSIGVFITRPAYSVILETLMKNRTK